MRTRSQPNAELLCGDKELMLSHNPKRNVFAALYQLLCEVFSGSQPAQPRQRSPPHYNRTTLIYSC